MGPPLTYKMFNLYFSIQYGTYKSNLHTTLLHKCESINSSCPLQTEAFTCLHHRCWLLHNGPTQGTYTVVVSFSTKDRLPQSYPSLNRGSNTIVESREELGGTIHFEARTTTQERDAILLPKTLRQWVLSIFLFIRCSTFTFLSNVGHITHTSTQHPFQFSQRI